MAVFGCLEHFFFSSQAKLNPLWLTFAPKIIFSSKKNSFIWFKIKSNNSIFIQYLREINSKETTFFMCSISLWAYKQSVHMHKPARHLSPHRRRRVSKGFAYAKHSINGHLSVVQSATTYIVANSGASAWNLSAPWICDQYYRRHLLSERRAPRVESSRKFRPRFIILSSTNKKSSDIERKAETTKDHRRGARDRGQGQYATASGQLHQFQRPEFSSNPSN